MYRQKEMLSESVLNTNNSLVISCRLICVKMIPIRLVFVYFNLVS